MIFEDVATKANRIAADLSQLSQAGVTREQAEVVLLLAYCRGECFTSTCNGCAVDHRLRELGVPAPAEQG